LPDVPSLTELGYPVQFAQWSGLFVPAGTPEPVVARLREAAQAAANDPKVVQTIGAAGSPILYLDAPEFTRYWTTDAAKMADAVQKIGRVE
jgi:tripartite-type tricarboxylate transporter receptor subunit TctC